MIIEIPEPQDYANASLNLLNLAWGLAVASMRAWSESDVIHPLDTDERLVILSDGQEIVFGGKDETYTAEERESAENDFWQRSQTALGNALSTVQQAVELALKGRIATVSPFLLVNRDPRDYPKSSSHNDIPFSAFRTVDAADLLRVHDAVCAHRLGSEFGRFWEKIRRERNLFIHSGTVGSLVKPASVMGNILEVSEFLFPEKNWFNWRLAYLDKDEFSAAYGNNPNANYTIALREFGYCLMHLRAGEVKRFFQYDKKSRLYRCIHCYDEMDHDYDDDAALADLAQLQPKGPESTVLRCVLCRQETRVLRQKCAECNCTVICDNEGDHWGECMSCHWPGIEHENADQSANVSPSLGYMINVRWMQRISAAS